MIVTMVSRTGRRKKESVSGNLGIVVVVAPVSLSWLRRTTEVSSPGLN